MGHAEGDNQRLHGDVSIPAPVCPACGAQPRASARFCDARGSPLSISGPPDATDDYAAIQRVIRALASSLELGPMMREVARASIGIAGAERCIILRWHPTTEEVEVLACESVLEAGAPLVETGARYPIDRRPILRSVMGGETVRTAGGNSSLSPADRRLFADLGAEAALFLPIALGDRVIGAFELHSTDAGAFPPARATTCAALATYAGIGLERGAAFERQRTLAARLRAVARAATDVAQELDPERLLDEVPTAIQEALGYDLVNVFLIDERSGSPWLRATAGLPIPAPIGDRMRPGEGIIGRTAETGRVHLAPDVRADPHYVPGPGLDGIRSEVAAPIVAQGRVLGVLDVQSLRADAFEDADAVALEALAAELGVALENARLFQQERDREHQLRTVIDSVPTPLAVVSVAGRVILTNQPMRELYQLPRDPVGLTTDEVDDLIPWHVKSTTEFLARAASSSVERPPEEVNVGDPPRNFIRRVTPVVIDDETRAYIVLFQEVTGERAALRAKDQLLSIAAHELRTPLTALLGFIDLIHLQFAREDLDLGLVRRRMATIRREARRLAALVEELLGLAQLEAGEMQLRPVEVDLAQLLGRVVERLTATIANADRIRIDKAPPGVACYWDDGRVDQILTNLIDNALKYSPPGSPVDITVDAGPDEIQITVHDHGSGLSDEQIARLFRPFARVVSSEWHAGGLGLGLYVSRSLAERHGGRLWIESAPGAGATAHLALPRRIG